MYVIAADVKVEATATSDSKKFADDSVAVAVKAISRE
jgi:hypothetical protein